MRNPVDQTTKDIFLYDKLTLTPLSYVDNSVVATLAEQGTLYMIESKRLLDAYCFKNIEHYTGACKVIPVSSIDDIIGSIQPYVYLFTSRF